MNTKKESVVKKAILLWAVDPSQDPEAAKNLVKEIKTWAKNLNCSVQPISIFSKKLLRFPLELSKADQDESLNTLESSISKFIRKAGMTDVLKPEILFIEGTSTRKKAQALAEEALHKKAMMIFAHTRAKPSKTLFRLGGFAEALVACSQVPVFLLNPKALPSAKIPSILFPTDFSRDSRNALTHLIPFAKAFQAKIHLFNQLEGPTYYASEYTGYASLDVRRWEMLLKDVEVARRRHAQAWMKSLEQQGIESEFTLSQQKNSVSSDILSFAKKSKVAAIAMATRSGSVSRFFLGSNARDVLLHASCPVILCYRPLPAMPLNPSPKARSSVTMEQALSQ